MQKAFTVCVWNTYTLFFVKSYFYKTDNASNKMSSFKQIEKKQKTKPLKKNDGKQSQPDRWTQDTLISTKQAPTEPLKG